MPPPTHRQRDDQRQEMAVDQRALEEWTARAHKSDCSRGMDKLFAGVDRDEVDSLKNEMFKMIFTTMGEEVEPEDLERAVVVHYQKFNQIFVVVLTVLTLGLFCLFRPRDDDTVLVLTKRDGRVFAQKTERTNFCEGRNSGALLMFVRYLVILFLVLLTPSFIYVLFYDNQDIDSGTDIWQQVLYEEEHLIRLLKAKEKISFYCYALGALVIVFFLYLNIPRTTHGTRSHQNHAARNLCVGQFTLTGGEFRRRAVLRLFFGRYPAQETLDTVGATALGHVAGPAPVSELQQGVIGSPTIIRVLTIGLSAITILDTSMSWVDRSVVVGKTVYSMHFCYNASGPEYCTREHCGDWAAERNLSGAFCRGVRWYADPARAEDKVQCYPLRVPCCRGCSEGSILAAPAAEQFRGWLDVMGDVGTLLFSLMAAKIALGWVKPRGHIEAVVERRHLMDKPTADFDLVRPLLRHFLEGVSSKASAQSREEQERLHRTMSEVHIEEDPNEAGRGVLNFEVLEDREDDVSDWGSFLRENQLVEPSDYICPWSLKVNVPRRCLGIPRDEAVLAAWGELPSQLWGTGSLPILFGVLGWIQHAVILTDRRMLYVRVAQRSWLLTLLNIDFGKDVRVDIFRHDRGIFFGHLYHTARPLLYRLVRAPWRPGHAFMQTRFGLLGMSRGHGNAQSCYNMVSQLAKSPQFITRQQLEASGVPWRSCEETWQGNLARRKGRVWSLARQPDDLETKDPDLYLADAAEQPVFHWAFKERGRWFSAFHTNTDVVVTTGRVFLWTRGFYKDYDCRTSLCYCCCWCACAYVFLRDELLLLERAPSTMSFMTLPSVLSFSTETRVDPAILCDPIHPPWRLPCWEALCTGCTRWMRCQTFFLSLDRDACLRMPGRTGPRTQLLLTWRLKLRVEDEELGMTCSLRPCALPDFDDEDLGNTFNDAGGDGYTAIGELPEDQPPSYEEQSSRVKMLWRITAVALRTFDKTELVVL